MNILAPIISNTWKRSTVKNIQYLKVHYPHQNGYKVLNIIGAIWFMLQIIYVSQPIVSTQS